MNRFFVMRQDGEIVAEQIWFKQKGAKYFFPGGFAIVGLVFFSKIAELKLPPDALRLVANMMASAPYGGLLNKPNEKYAKELGITKPRVSKLIGDLHEIGVIHRAGPRLIFINPVYFFRGTPEEQNKAVEQWNDFRRELIGSRTL